MKLKGLVAALLGAFLLSACNTMEGIGKDVQRSGKSLDREATEARR